MSAAWTEHIDWQRLDADLTALPKGQRTAYVDRIAEAHGVSRSTIYRERAKRCGKTKTVDREATAVTDEQARLIAEIKESYNTITLKGTSRELSTEAAIRIAEEEGHIEPGALAVRTVNAALRERYGYREVQPRVRVEAAYACQQYQIDFSRSKHFQVIDDLGDGDWLLQVSAKELHYKDGAARLRTWVVQVMDEYSRLRHVIYRAATGEDTLLGLAALRHVLNRPEDDHLMRHVPERLKGDQGAFLKSNTTREALRALGIEVVLTEPENKESQGKIERGFRTLWQQFEAPIATRLVRQHGDKATLRLSKLNRMVQVFCVKEHEQRHPTYRRLLRGDMYQRSILRHRPPVLDVDVRDLALQVWERKADDSGLIYLNGVPFEVPQFAYAKWVRVYRSVNGDFVGTLIDGFRDQPFTIRPFRFRDLDDFDHRAHRTFAQEMHAQAKDQRAAATERQQQAPQRLTHQAQAAALDSPVQQARKADDEPTKLSALDAAAQLGRALREQGLDPKDFDLHRYVHDGITRAEVDDLIDAVLTTHQRKAI